jgi:hypothetical protein
LEAVKNEQIKQYQVFKKQMATETKDNEETYNIKKDKKKRMNIVRKLFREVSCSRSKRTESL